MKFVDVKNDVAFHKIFGHANRAIVRIAFLNAVLIQGGSSWALLAGEDQR